MFCKSLVSCLWTELLMSCSLTDCSWVAHSQVAHELFIHKLLTCSFAHKLLPGSGLCRGWFSRARIHTRVIKEWTRSLQWFHRSHQWTRIVYHCTSVCCKKEGTIVVRTISSLSKEPDNMLIVILFQSLKKFPSTLVLGELHSLLAK